MQCDAKVSCGCWTTAPEGDRSAKLVGWDTVNKASREDNPVQASRCAAGAVFPDDAFFNDLAVDLTHNAIYVSHSAGIEDSALIVVNLATGRGPANTAGHESMVPEQRDLCDERQGAELYIARCRTAQAPDRVNPIALDAADEWLYYGTMNGKKHV